MIYSFWYFDAPTDSLSIRVLSDIETISCDDSPAREIEALVGAKSLSEPMLEYC